MTTIILSLSEVILFSIPTRFFKWKHKMRADSRNILSVGWWYDYPSSTVLQIRKMCLHQQLHRSNNPHPCWQRTPLTVSPVAKIGMTTLLWWQVGWDSFNLSIITVILEAVISTGKWLGVTLMLYLVLSGQITLGQLTWHDKDWLWLLRQILWPISSSFYHQQSGRSFRICASIIFVLNSWHLISAFGLTTTC